MTRSKSDALKPPVKLVLLGLAQPEFGIPAEPTPEAGI